MLKELGTGERLRLVALLLLFFLLPFSLFLHCIFFSRIWPLPFDFCFCLSKENERRSICQEEKENFVVGKYNIAKNLKFETDRYDVQNESSLLGF